MHIPADLDLGLVRMNKPTTRYMLEDALVRTKVTPSRNRFYVAHRIDLNIEAKQRPHISSHRTKRNSELDDLVDYICLQIYAPLTLARQLHLAAFAVPAAIAHKFMLDGPKLNS